MSTTLLVYPTAPASFSKTHFTPTVLASPTCNLACSIIVLTPDGTHGGAPDEQEACKEIVVRIRKEQGKGVFIILWSEQVSSSAVQRTRWQSIGVNMITCVPMHLTSVLSTLHTLLTLPPTNKMYPCPYCPACLPLEALQIHLPLYHTQEPNRKSSCPICGAHTRYLAVHVHTHNTEPIPRLPLFALVVCIKDNKVLLVDEVAGQGWWIPGGGVDPGEDFCEAATREVREETGMEVELKGVLRIEVSPGEGYPRMRVIFYAEPTSTSPPPKSIPDYESAGACFVSPTELDSLPLRGREPVLWTTYLQQGGIIHSLSVIGKEWARPAIGS
ncbi:hypothetical protein SpCBS45565_g01796 [Spizellomyces sp. 'palustris']|nr:hypothetical protein SpCBS45565_g01796 [Spizellomyces sp. 'palustris']